MTDIIIAVCLFWIIIGGITIDINDKQYHLEISFGDERKE